MFKWIFHTKISCKQCEEAEYIKYILFYKNLIEFEFYKQLAVPATSCVWNLTKNIVQVAVL